MVVRGEVETTMEGKTTVAQPGIIKFHPRHVPHAERALHGSMVELLTIVWREAEGASYAGWPRQVEDRTGRIRQMLEWMLELWPARDADTQTTLDAMLHAIIYAYAGTAGRAQDQLVLAIRAWVCEHLALPIYLDDMAAVVGMNRFHFSRAFRRSAGRTPMRFVRELRVDAARALILSSSLPLRTIASRVGFTDEFQLSRVFRLVNGQPPTSLRRGRLRG